MTKIEAEEFANHWIAAWNAHDLDAILAHYEDDIELTSPALADTAIGGPIGGKLGSLTGKANLRAYFQRGLHAYPALHFQLEDVLLAINSIVLYFINQRGTHTAEFMELSETGKISRVIAHYSA